MPKWDYLEYENDEVSDTVKARGQMLKELGNQGWELVAVVVVPNRYDRYVFKRPRLP